MSSLFPITGSTRLCRTPALRQALNPVRFAAAQDTNSPATGSSLWQKLGMLFKVGMLATVYSGIQYPVAMMRNHTRGEAFNFSSNVAYQYYVPDGTVHFKPKTFSPHLRMQQHYIASRIAEVLQDRPDLLEAIRSIPKGLEIRLYEAEGLVSPGANNAHSGLAEIRNGKTAMEFAVQSTQQGIDDPTDGYEVVCHELAHLLDFLGDSSGSTVQVVGPDGYLPGWSTAQKEAFAQAREAEKPKIAQQLSPIRNYALENDDEFLAVAVETFFEKPAALKASNPKIYGMLQQFFRLDPAAGPAWSVVKETLKGDFSYDYLYNRDKDACLYTSAAAGLLVLMMAGKMYIVRRFKPKGPDAE